MMFELNCRLSNYILMYRKYVILDLSFMKKMCRLYLIVFYIKLNYLNNYDVLKYFLL